MSSIVVIVHGTLNPGLAGSLAKDNHRNTEHRELFGPMLVTVSFYDGSISTFLAIYKYLKFQAVEMKYYKAGK
jgi:hypothetical protein